MKFDRVDASPTGAVSQIFEAASTMHKQTSTRSQKCYVEGFEELVLGVVWKLQGNAYGVTIWQELEEAGRSAALGQIYATLDRLEANGFVNSELGEATMERGGRRKKLFKITGEGIKAINRASQIRSVVFQGVPQS